MDKNVNQNGLPFTFTRDKYPVGIIRFQNLDEIEYWQLTLVKQLLFYLFKHKPQEIDHLAVRYGSEGIQLRIGEVYVPEVKKP